MLPWILCIGTAVLVALATFLLLLLSESRRPRVICLMYHRLADAEAYGRTAGTERIFTLPDDEFERQIAHLAGAGYTFVTPNDVRRFVAGELVLPDPSVLITFDDGCVSVDRIARPILARHGARGTVFVTTDPDSYVFGLGGDRRLTDEELLAGDGDTIGFESHAVSHRPLRGMPDAEIRRELAESKQELERILSREVRYLAIPGNWFDRRVMQIARAAGYHAVWCSHPGKTRVGADPFGLPRINVEGHLTGPQFAAAIRPFGIVQRRLVSLIKRTPGRLLGPRYWLPLRRVIMRCIPGGYVTTRRILAGAGVVVVLGVLALLWWLA